MPASQVNTGVYLPLATHRLLRAAAQGRQHLHGGRVSVSKIVAEIVEKHSEELRVEAEALSVGQGEV
jgi:hypothetical protein